MIERHLSKDASLFFSSHSSDKTPIYYSMNNKTKTCRKCGEEKTLDCYNKNKRNKDGLHLWCRTCKKAADREYSSKNKEKARARAKQWYKDNTDRAKERIREWQQSDHGKQRRKVYRDRVALEKPEYWRMKKKRDKANRRAKEFQAGPLSFSSVQAVEAYNKEHFCSDSLHCEYCSSVVRTQYELEHITPLSRGGTNETNNLAISCSGCNRGMGGKHTKLIEEWKPSLSPYFQNRKL